MSIVGTDYTSLDHRVIDAAIASRVCGWTRRKARTGAVYFFSPESWADIDTRFPEDEGSRSWTPCDVGGEDNAPYYSADYNAVHEALWKLSVTQVAVSVRPERHIDVPLATPRQICEAILEALDKEAAR